MNTSQDIKMKMVDDNVGNQVRQNAMQNDGNEVGQIVVQNSGIQNVENMNGLSIVPEIANEYGNGNVVAARAEGNSNGSNDNHIRCFNSQEEGHHASTCTVKPKKQDATYLMQQMQIARKKEQASTSGTQSDNAPVYDSDGSTELPPEYIECKNIKLAIRNAKSEVVCAMCKQCLITANHDVCMLNYVNDMNSHALNKNANVENVENQKKHKPKVRKPKKVGSKERLDSSKPSTPRSCLGWSPTGRMFDLKGKIIATSESVCQSDCSKGCQNWFDTLLIPLLSEYKSKEKETHGDNERDN
ncbi:hypothetical protein Tco_1131652 [Tanacetum coccineum]